MLSGDPKNGKGADEAVGVMQYERDLACHCDFEGGGRGA